MLSYFLSRLQNKDKPWFKPTKKWLVVGKGPSFKNIYKLDTEDYHIFGLNHVASILQCTIAAAIDIEVVTEQMVHNAEAMLLPWHVHKKFHVVREDLNQVLHYNEFLLSAFEQNKLFYYNASTWKGSLEKDIVTVRYNIGEVPFVLLGMCGIKEIHSVGIDGGTDYAMEFKIRGLIPLTNGRKNFDDSIRCINHTCQKFGIKWKRL